MSETFSTARAVELLTAGEIVRIKLASAPAVDAIAAGALQTFDRIRQVAIASEFAMCLWAIRREDYCVPFVRFDGIDDRKLWQNFMLFDRFRGTKPEYAIPVLLIGDRDIFGAELAEKPNDVLSSKVTHLDPQ